MPIQAVIPKTNKKLYRLPRKRWTRLEYERLVDLGVLEPEDRLELIEGEIVRKMPHKSPHATGICLAEEAVRGAFSAEHYARTQLPLALGDYSEPEPDIAVVKGTARDYKEAHPRTAALVIEVADTTLRVDCTTKAGIYARAGIEEYWVVDLNARQLIVHRQPVPMRGRPLGHYYASVVRYTETESVTPLAAPDAVIAVADLLP